MKRNLSTAISTIENAEKKTQLAWVVPISLQRYSMCSPRVQYFERRSTRVRGMVKVQRRMSEMARLAMKMFLVVSMTWLVRKASRIAKLPTTPKMMTRE